MHAASLQEVLVGVSSNAILKRSGTRQADLAAHARPNADSIEDGEIQRMDAPRLTDIDFEAVFTLEQARAAEHNDRLGFGRRITLLALTKNKAELVDTVRKIGAEPFSAWLDQVEDFQRELQHLLDLSSSAHARLLVAGQVVVEQAPKH